MKTIRTLVGRLREFKKPAILTPLFIIGEVILECLIPLTMVSLVDALDGVSLSPVMSLGLILARVRHSVRAFCGDRLGRPGEESASGSLLQGAGLLVRGH